MLKPSVNWAFLCYINGQHMKPRTHKTQSNKFREMRIAKGLSAADAIGTVEKDSDTYILTFGQFSLIDAIVTIIDQVGPSDVTISTWTAADAHIEKTAEMLAASSIKRLRLIVDRSFESRQPGYCYQMRKRFGADCIRAIRTHAKFAIIRSDGYDIVVRTSMNLNENPRLENIEISESKGFAEFFQTIADEIFSEVDEGQNRSQMLELKGLEDSSPYKEVDAKQLDRTTLSEPNASHTLKNH
jgi:hypothetical protein